MPKKVNLALYRGDTFGMVVAVWEDQAETIPVDLTGATARAQLRPYPSSDEVSGTFGTQISGNEIALTLTDDVSAGLAPGAYAYDVELVWAAGSVLTVVNGAATVAADVTR